MEGDNITKQFEEIDEQTQEELTVTMNNLIGGFIKDNPKIKKMKNRLVMLILAFCFSLIANVYLILIVSGAL